jgi:hypothetical protein
MRISSGYSEGSASYSTYLQQEEQQNYELKNMVPVIALATIKDALLIY